MSKLLPASGCCLLFFFSAVNPILYAQETDSKDEGKSEKIAASLTPDSATSQLEHNVGEFLNKLEQKNYAEATADFETLVKNQWNESFKTYIAKRLRRETNSRGLRLALKLASVAHPEDAALQRLSAYIFLLQNEDEKTVRERLDKAIKLDATNPVPFLLRGKNDRFSRYYKLLPTSGIRRAFPEETAKSVDDISEAIRLEPNSPAFYLLRAELSGIYLGNKSAIDDVDAAMKLNHDPFECLLLRGQINSCLENHHAALGDFAQAIDLYERQMIENGRTAYVDYSQLIPTDPPLVSCYFYRGKTKAELKDYRGAIDDFNATLKQSKHLEKEVYEQRALMYIAVKDYPAALADLNSSGNFFRQKERRAWVKLQLKDYQGALKDYDEAVASYESDWEALMGRGITKHRLTDDEGAMNDLNKAIELVGSFKAEPSIARGVLYLDTKDAQKALLDFDRAIQVDPDQVGAYFQRGLANHALRNYKAAINDFGRVIVNEPENVGAFFNRGLAQRADEQFSDAIASFNVAIKLDPHRPRSFYFRGMTKQDSGDNSAALADYDQALVIDPKYISAYLQRASAKILLNDFKSALADFDTAIQLDNNSLKAITGKSFLLSTCSDDSLRDSKTASDLADKASRIDAEDPSALNARACANAAAGNFESAIALEEQALSNSRFSTNTDIDAGLYAQERITAWKANKLWTIPPAPK